MRASSPCISIHWHKAHTRVDYLVARPPARRPPACSHVHIIYSIDDTRHARAHTRTRARTHKHGAWSALMTTPSSVASTQPPRTHSRHTHTHWCRRVVAARHACTVIIMLSWVGLGWFAIIYREEEGSGATTLGMATGRRVASSRTCSSRPSPPQYLRPASPACKAGRYCWYVGMYLSAFKQHVVRM